MRYLDDVLVLSGLAILGGCVWLWFGAIAALAYAGTILVILGLVLGWQGRVAR